MDAIEQRAREVARTLIGLTIDEAQAAVDREDGLTLHTFPARLAEVRLSLGYVPGRIVAITRESRISSILRPPVTSPDA